MLPQRGTTMQVHEQVIVGVVILLCKAVCSACVAQLFWALKALLHRLLYFSMHLLVLVQGSLCELRCRV